VALTLVSVFIRLICPEKTRLDDLWKKLEGREPDILVNNAGIYPTKPFLDIDETSLKSNERQSELRVLDVPKHDQKQVE